jgi:tRNA uridine 5-carbamoylmethylation protein Kti12
MTPLPLVILMRGLPGSGKSTEAQNLRYKLTKGHVLFSAIVSADTYQERWFGGSPFYDFRDDLATFAHAACFRAFIKALSDSVPLVIVDNTNTHPMNLVPYALASQAFCREFVICDIHCNVETSLKRNIHEVPQAVIERMAANLDLALPGTWKVESVSDILGTNEDMSNLLE